MLSRVKTVEEMAASGAPFNTDCGTLTFPGAKSMFVYPMRSLCGKVFDFYQERAGAPLDLTSKRLDITWYFEPCMLAYTTREQEILFGD